MDIRKRDIIKMIIQEIRSIQTEDISKLNFLTPAAALRFMRRELNGKNLIFFDLETMGFRGQITQVAAFSYKIEDLDAPPPDAPSGEFLAKIKINDETLEQQARQRRRNPSELAQIKANNPNYKTVDDLLKYTHYDNFLPEFEPLDEKRVIKDFFEWIRGVDNGVLVGHNIKSFDLNRLLKRAKDFSIDTTKFEKSDIFDTRTFSETIFKNAMMIAYNYDDAIAKELLDFTEEQKVKFSGKLDKLMKIFNDSSSIQLHTADDDTRQLVSVFFAMYGKILEIEQEHGKGEFMSKKFLKDRSLRIELHKHMKRMGMFTDRQTEQSLKKIVSEMPHQDLEELVMRIRSEPNYIPEF